MSARGRVSTPALFGMAVVVLAVVAIMVMAVRAPQGESPEQAARAVFAALERSDYHALYDRLGPGARRVDRFIVVPETPGPMPGIVMESARAYLGLTPNVRPEFILTETGPQRVRLEVLGAVRPGIAGAVTMFLPTKPRMILVRTAEGPWQWEFVESIGDEVSELQERGLDAIKAITELLSALPLDEILELRRAKPDAPAVPPTPTEEAQPDDQPRTTDSQ